MQLVPHEATSGWNETHGSPWAVVGGGGLASVWLAGSRSSALAPMKKPHMAHTAAAGARSMAAESESNPELQRTAAVALEVYFRMYLWIGPARRGRPAAGAGALASANVRARSSFLFLFYVLAFLGC